MKCYVFLLILTLGLISCKSSSQKENNQPNSTTIDHTKSKKAIHRVDNITFAEQIAASPDAQIVDVRTPEEHKQGSIKNALNINYYDDDFAAQAVSKLDKNKPVLLYCARGGRSAKAAKMLKKEGFTDIYDLETGYNGWGKKWQVQVSSTSSK